MAISPEYFDRLRTHIIDEFDRGEDWVWLPLHKMEHDNYESFTNRNYEIIKFLLNEELYVSEIMFFERNKSSNMDTYEVLICFTKDKVLKAIMEDGYNTPCRKVHFMTRARLEVMKNPSLL